jgi:hypothetical protein
MAKHTITTLFDRFGDAQNAVRELETTGIPHSDISIVANQANSGYRIAPVGAETEAAAGAGTGAAAGAVLGGGAGLLAGLGIIAIPGLGPVVAAGWLAAAAVTAAAAAGVGGMVGGLIGSLIEAGVSEPDAHLYAEGVRRGGALVTVRAEENQLAEVHAILRKNAPVDMLGRGEAYRADGWTGFDPNARPYSASEADRERERASYGGRRAG